MENQHTHRHSHHHVHPASEAAAGPVRWELRMRFLSAFIWVIGVGALTSIPLILAAGLLAILFLIAMGIPLKRILKRVLLVAPFLIISYITLLLSDGFPVTAESFYWANLIAARVIVSVLAITLVSVDAVQEYLGSFAAMRFPHALTSTLFLTQRYVHLIGQQLVSIRNALMSRLFSPQARLKTLKVYGQITGGMTVKAIDRSQHVQRAMMSRGFDGRIRAPKARAIHAADIGKAVAAALLMTAFLILERWFI